MARGRYFAERDDFEKAVDYYKRSIALDPDYALPWLGLGSVYGNQTLTGVLPADSGRALRHEAMQRALELGPDLAQVTERFASRHAMKIAEGHAYRGEIDEAFVWLERAYEQRDPLVPWVRGNRLLVNLEDDPRYEPFLERMGLAD